MGFFCVCVGGSFFLFIGVGYEIVQFACECVGTLVVLCVESQCRLVKVDFEVSTFLDCQCENVSGICNKWRAVRVESGQFKAGRQEGCF